MMKLKIVSADEQEKACGTGGEKAILTYHGTYAVGDRLVLETDAPGLWCMVQLEDSMAPALVLVAGRILAFAVPPAGNRPNYSPKSFTGSCHYLWARPATTAEVSARRNLALNPYDHHENTTFYPHATANVETRGEAVFAARNAIDGIYANTSHGAWPYQSWGINRDPNAALTLDFGCSVTLDEARLTLRADYPHDNHWVSAMLRFDDGTTEQLKLSGVAEPQIFHFAPRTVRRCVLDTLIQAESPSPFPALTQLELWGTAGNKT